MFWENIKLALEAMKTSKLRTALSLLGIVIGVGAVVAILNLGASATTNITKSLSSGGSDVITIYTQPTDRTANILNVGFGSSIKNSTEGIKSVMPLMEGYNIALRSADSDKSATIQGVESTYFGLQKIEFDHGSKFSDNDNLNAKQVIVLGSDLADKLFPGKNAIGENVNLIFTESDGKMKTFTVVGVLKKKEQSYTMSYNNSAFVPFNTFVDKIYNRKVVSSYIVQTLPGYDTVKVSDQINKYLDSTVGPDSYQSFSPAMLVNMANEVTGTLSLFLAAIAGISLLVGGIGIMNIMLVSVAERTKEIGIRKALGASPSVIRGQFIVEAVTLTLVGGLIGILFGSGLSFAVTNIAKWELQLSYNSFLVAMGFSMLVGIFFGWYPAMTASKLDPIEALNYE